MVNDSKNINCIFLVNISDNETIHYLNDYSLQDDFNGWEILYENLESPNISEFFNQMYEKTIFNQDDTLVSMLGDDMVCCRHGRRIEVICLIFKWTLHDSCYR